jgi:hypothetical protein
MGGYSRTPGPELLLYVSASEQLQRDLDRSLQKSRTQIIVRLVEEFHVEGRRQTGAILTEEHWVAEVGVWPETEEKVEQVRRVLAPMEVRTFARREPTQRG